MATCCSGGVDTRRLKQPMIYVLISWLARPLLWVFARRRRHPPARILVVQAAKIGDSICSSPMFRELRRQYPNAHITALCSPAAEPLLRNNPRIDEVIALSPTNWRGLAGKLAVSRSLRRGHFDTVLCCNGGVIWPVVTLWAGIPCRIGIIPNFGGSSQRLAGSLWTVGMPHRGDRLIVETYFDMLAKLGVRPSDSHKEVFAAPGAEARVAQWLPVDGVAIGLAVSAANKLKELGTEKLAVVVQNLLTSVANRHVILLGTEADGSRSSEILAKLPPECRVAVIDTCGQIELADLPALVAKLDVFVGVDSGLTYMADALDIPLVSVAGPCNMGETRPVGPRVSIIQRQLPCLPCAHIFNAPTSCWTGTLACIRDISADEVVAAVDAIQSEK